MSRYLMLLGLFAGGCVTENELRYLSTLPSRTHGVVLSEDAIESYVAMNGTTCTIEPSWGCPTEDVDLPTDRERIVDHFEGRTLAQSTAGVHLLTGSAWDATDDVLVADVKVARLTRGGPLVLHGASASCSLRLPSGVEVSMPGEVCGADLEAAVDRDGDALWLATGERVVRVDAEGIRSVLGDEDLVARDDTLHVAYLARRQGRKLRAVDDLGRVQWEVLTRGPVVDVATRGGRGDVLVLQRDGELGLLERRSGTDGQVLASYPLPGAEGEMVVSANGVGLAIEQDDEVHYYVFEVPGEPVYYNPTPAACPDLLDRTAVD